MREGPSCSTDIIEVIALLLGYIDQITFWNLDASESRPLTQKWQKNLLTYPYQYNPE